MARRSRDDLDRARAMIRALSDRRALLGPVEVSAWLDRFDALATRRWRKHLLSLLAIKSDPLGEEVVLERLFAEIAREEHIIERGLPDGRLSFALWWSDDLDDVCEGVFRFRGELYELDVNMEESLDSSIEAAVRTLRAGRDFIARQWELIDATITEEWWEAFRDELDEDDDARATTHEEFVAWFGFPDFSFHGPSCVDVIFDGGPFFGDHVIGKTIREEPGDAAVSVDTIFFG